MEIGFYTWLADSAWIPGYSLTGLQFRARYSVPRKYRRYGPPADIVDRLRPLATSTCH
uniref:Uncharacterized protein n=1 Tax=Picea sitchensis TaxID=3332 RepID=A0A6B9XR64_PICSI|nr:hypothetical protein Q903MT_gene5665 [Picea sitchensis]